MEEYAYICIYVNEYVCWYMQQPPKNYAEWGGKKSQEVIYYMIWFITILSELYKWEQFDECQGFQRERHGREVGLATTGTWEILGEIEMVCILTITIAIPVLQDGAIEGTWVKGTWASCALSYNYTLIYNYLKTKSVT